MSVAAAILCACALAGVSASAGSASAKHPAQRVGVKTYATAGTLPLRTGIFDPFDFVGDSSTAYDLARAAGATYIRVPFDWSSIAPAKLPTSFVATDPASPGYDWTALDDTVTSLEAAGLTPILDVVSPPAWGYATRPTRFNAGTPIAKDLGDFMRAVATHYDGANLGPAVHDFQVWNEPNLTLDMSPTSAVNYRTMVNDVAAAVHAVDPANLVVAGGLDPFGHKPVGKTQWHSEAPLDFMRTLLCLSAGAHPHAACSTPVHFDVWSHHPYSFGGPFAKATHAGDVSLGDLPEMDSLLKTAQRLHHIVSAQPVQFWVTEFSWDTSPPRAHAAPMALAERWTAESLYQMWRSGVSLATWFMLVDQPSPSLYQCGFYFHSKSLETARAKPTLTAFRFPFVALLGRGKVNVWGRDATSTKTVVTIQRRHGVSGGWRTVARVEANRFGIFKAAIKLPATKTDWLRAIAPGSGTSLAFSLTEPSDPNIGPWGSK